MLTIKAGDYVLATYEYADNNGKLLKLTYGNGDYEEYIYDILERLVEVKLNGATEYVVKYDSNGRLYSLTESGSTHIYEYDSLDRLIRAWQEDSSGTKVLEVENSYDDLGRAKGSTYVVNGREMSYEVYYKANSNLVNYVMMPTAGLQSNISYTYDEFERVTKKQNSFSTSLNFYEAYGYYSYTDENDVEHATSLVSSVTFGGSSSNTTPAIYTYVYDNLGNITQIKKDGTIVYEYTYDTLGQLVCEEDAVKGETYIYTYDKAGNITKKDKYPYYSGTLMWDYINYLADYKETVTTYTYGDSTWGDMLTAYNGTAITYDAIGNPTNWRNAVGLTWEGRELQRADLATNSYVNYTYNSDGIRTSRSYVNANVKYNETRNYVLDGSKIIQESIRISTISSTTNATLYYLYDESGSVQGFIYNNAYYYFQKNLQGDVIRILNDYGTVVVEYTYDAWGKVLTTTGSLASTIGTYNPFRYRSYYYDVETGFYYLQSRYYDPTVGRFLNADGIIGANGGIEGYNMFAYCNNNPVMYADYSGRFFEGIWDFAKTTLSEIGKALEEMAPAYAVCGGMAVADGPAPVGDAAGIAGAVVITAGAVGVGIYRAIKQRSTSIPKVGEKFEIKRHSRQVTFPENPNEFKPIGLVKVYRDGTKNGSLISWMHPISRIEVFRWDENTEYSNGPHYHIFGLGHYYPGDDVPEPFLTYYFPFGQ